MCIADTLTEPFRVEFFRNSYDEGTLTRIGELNDLEVLGLEGRRYATLRESVAEFSDIFVDARLRRDILIVKPDELKQRVVAGKRVVGNGVANARRSE